MKEYLGKSVLFAVADAAFDGRVLEATVLTFSPSGKYVSMGYQWFAVEKVSVLEVLPDETPAPRRPSAAVPTPPVQTSGTTASDTAPATTGATEAPTPPPPGEPAQPEAAPAPVVTV